MGETQPLLILYKMSNINMFIHFLLLYLTLPETCSLTSFYFFLEREGVHWQAEHDPCSGKSCLGSFLDLLSPLWGMFSLHFALLLLVY